RYIPDRFLPDKALDLLDEAAASLQLQVAGSEQAQEVGALKKQLDSLRTKKEQAIETENYEEALQTKRKEDVMTEKLAAFSRELAQREDSKKLSIGKEHIAKVVADSTGIPVTRLLKSEVKKLVKLEEVLRRSIIGQEEAISAIARYVRRS